MNISEKHVRYLVRTIQKQLARLKPQDNDIEGTIGDVFLECYSTAQEIGEACATLGIAPEPYVMRYSREPSEIRAYQHQEREVWN